jgi:hypothetical protein
MKQLLATNITTGPDEFPLKKMSAHLQSIVQQWSVVGSYISIVLLMFYFA